MINNPGSLSQYLDEARNSKPSEDELKQLAQTVESLYSKERLSNQFIAMLEAIQATSVGK